jgi:XTP/dITP diphosphohydrolase
MKIKKILFATKNLGKQSEIRDLFKDIPIEFIFPQDINQCSNVEAIENGKTFRQNALKKAKTFAHYSGLPTCGEDSGLMVEALDGQPGVHSARWAPGDDNDRNQALLDAMKSFSQREAKFKTVICFYIPTSKRKYYFDGEIEGRITRSPRGVSGFGYDPIFIPIGDSKTFSQLGKKKKNELSHRRQAWDKFMEFIKSKRYKL